MLRRLTIALVPGAVTALAVAWATWWFPRPFAPGGPIIFRDAADGYWMGDVRSAPGWHRSYIWPAAGLTAHGRHLAEPMPSWTRPPADAEVVEIVGAGWPAICVNGSRVGTDDSEAHWQRTGVLTTGMGPAAVVWAPWRGVIVLDEEAALLEATPPAGLLPWHPVWSGVIVNTLLWAVPWMLLLSITPLRRTSRRRRGRCARCGYDLRGRADVGDGCPECGTLVAT